MRRERSQLSINQKSALLNCVRKLSDHIPLFSCNRAFWSFWALGSLFWGWWELTDADSVRESLLFNSYREFLSTSWNEFWGLFCRWVFISPSWQWNAGREICLIIHSGKSRSDYQHTPLWQNAAERHSGPSPPSPKTAEVLVIHPFNYTESFVILKINQKSIRNIINYKKL